MFEQRKWFIKRNFPRTFSVVTQFRPFNHFRLGKSVCRRKLRKQSPWKISFPLFFSHSFAFAVVSGKLMWKILLQFWEKRNDVNKDQFAADFFCSNCQFSQTFVSFAQRHKLIFFCFAFPLRLLTGSVHRLKEKRDGEKTFGSDDDVNWCPGNLNWCPFDCWLFQIYLFTLKINCAGEVVYGCLFSL